METPTVLWELHNATGNTAACTVEQQQSGTVRLDVMVGPRLAVTESQPDMSLALAKARKILGELAESGWTAVYVDDRVHQA
jgi:hypothetical protein